MVWIVRIIAACISGGLAHPAQAQGKEAAFPMKPIRWIVPSASGTPPDWLARLFGERLGGALGQPVIIENRPGASGTIGLAQVARAAPDGHTIGFMSPPNIVAPSLITPMPYETLRELAPVSMLVWSHSVLAVPASSPYKTVAELVSQARARPETIKYSSAGNGTPPHLSAALFAREAGATMTHVPYKGPAGNAALVAGDVDFMVLNVAQFSPLFRAGKLRGLATAAPDRITAHPELPTMAEVGYPAVKVADSQGIVAPAGTPQEVIERLHAEVSKILADDALRKRLESVGYPPAGLGPNEYGAFLRSEIVRLGIVVRDARIRAD